MSFLNYAIVLVLLISASDDLPTASAFKCTSPGARCNGLAGYVTPNQTTLSHIQSLFGVQTLNSLLAANNLPLSTLSSHSLSPNQTVNVPFKCLCSNGTGAPLNRLPLYTVVKDDGLWHIAAEVFGGLVTYQQIQVANNITDSSLIDVGQKLWIPLQCSCDSVDGQKVVHYTHVVTAGSSLEEIAKQYNTNQSTLMALNDLSNPKALLANTPLDVPLQVCTSTVEAKSSDYPLLVANGTSAVTAGDCVLCKCDVATNNSTLQCEQSSLSSSKIAVDNSSSANWKTCPSMQCEGGNLYLGNITQSSSCNHTTCSYAGYNNQTILTTLSTYSTCSVPVKDSARKVGIQGWSWGYLLAIHLMVLYVGVV